MKYFIKVLAIIFLLIGAFFVFAGLTASSRCVGTTPWKDFISLLPITILGLYCVLTAILLWIKPNIGKYFAIVAATFVLIKFMFNFSLSIKSVGCSTITETKTPTFTTTPKDDEVVDWKTYSNSKYNVSFKYPSALTVKEIDPVKSGEASVETGNLLWVNVDNNFTVEILSKKPAPPYDYVSENYSQKQQITFGTDKKLLTAYLNLGTTQGECYGVSTVRGSCKDYFAVPVQGQKYWYIFTGVLANKAISKDQLNILSSVVIE